MKPVLVERLEQAIMDKEEDEGCINDDEEININEEEEGEDHECVSDTVEHEKANNSCRK